MIKQDLKMQNLICKILYGYIELDRSKYYNLSEKSHAIY